MVKNKDGMNEVEEGSVRIQQLETKGCRQKCDSQSYLRE